MANSESGEGGDSVYYHAGDGHAAARLQGRKPRAGRIRDGGVPLFGIEAFRSTRGSEFDNAALDEFLDVFGITGSPSKKDRPCDNAIDESADKALKAELAYREQFCSLPDLQVRLNDYAWWCNNERTHSTLGYMSPAGFRKACLSL